jgi:hypothetical protein
LRAAARAGRPVILLSAPDAGIQAGAGWFTALVAEARAAVPAAECGMVLDCGDDPAAALVAIRRGVERVVFSGRPDVAERLADIAGQYGVTLESERPAAALDLDLLAAEPALAERLASVIGVC